MSEIGSLKDCTTIKAIRQKMLPILEKNHQTFPIGRGLSYPSFAKALSPIIKQSKT
jgi:hypothetical protein